MLETNTYKRTVLTDRHEQLGARMAPFGGFLMPIQYAGIVAEHEAARSRAVVFDTCHMGEFSLSGTSALEDLERLVSCDVASMAVGQSRYGMMCTVAGGVIDDLLVYRSGEQEFMLVVNAGTQDADFDWVTSHTSTRTVVRNISAVTAKIDVQGPGAPQIVQRMMEMRIGGLKFYRFHENRFNGHRVLVSRTGYTGEVGFELYADPEVVVSLWDRCLDEGVVPAGLGARDTLRLEVGLPLYGHELGIERNAGMTGFSRAISATKGFIGAEAVRDPSALTQRLVGIVFEGRQAAREGNRIVSAEGVDIGQVTSGSFAPSLGHAVALAYVDAAHAVPGTAVGVEARRRIPGEVTELPFYREGTARKSLGTFLA